jgi:spore coat polysaccharide biosynthesis protein SpsF
MLAYQVQRLRRWLPRVLIPTGDSTLLALRAHGVAIHEVYGDPQDVLGRLARYVRAFTPPGTIIVRTCGDCPLLCPSLLDDILAQWDATPGLAYLGMGHGWPDGLADYDVLTREALLEMDAAATRKSDREHVVPYCWRSPEHFKQALFQAPDWVRARPWPKLSVDTTADLAYAEKVGEKVQQECGAGYTWRNVLSTIAATTVLQRRPEPMNAAYVTQVAYEQGRTVLTWEDARGLGQRETSPTPANCLGEIFKHGRMSQFELDSR